MSVKIKTVETQNNPTKGLLKRTYTYNVTVPFFYICRSIEQKQQILIRQCVIDSLHLFAPNISVRNFRQNIQDASVRRLTARIHGHALFFV